MKDWETRPFGLPVSADFGTAHLANPHETLRFSQSLLSESFGFFCRKLQGGFGNLRKGWFSVSDRGLLECARDTGY